MKLTKEQLKQIIKEELDSTQERQPLQKAGVAGPEPEEIFTMAIKRALKAGMDPGHMMATIEIIARTAAGTHEMPDGSVVAPK